MTKLTRTLVFGTLALALFAGTACQTATGRTAGTYIDDTAITAQLKSRLAAAQAETLTRVDVDTRNGTVYLTSTVADAAMKARAEEIARTQEGVTRVVINLQVNPRLSR